MAQVSLFTGTSRSARALHMDNLMRAHGSHARLVLPTRHAASRRLNRVVLDSALRGVWGMPVQSFGDFASGLLTAEGVRVRQVEEIERRLLVEGVVRRLAAQGRLRELGGAATSDGFVNHILRVITQIKQAAIDPASFRAAVAARARKSWLDAIVAEVYEGYQETLIETGSYDRVGIYWKAELLAHDHHPTALKDVHVLILDDFDDFTPSEFRLVETLASRIEGLVFGIDCCISDPSQRDLYAIPLKSAETIRRTYRIVEEREFPEPAARTYVDFAARTIFWRNKPVAPAGLEPNIEIVACPDLRQELELIGRRVKTLLVEKHVPCDRIAVVFRSLADIAPVARRVFLEFGIPVQMHAPVSLGESSLASFVLTLLDAVDTWTRDPVLDVLTSPWFAVDRARETCIDLFPLLARHAGIIEGFDEWHTRLKRLLARLEQGAGEDVEGLLRRAPHAREATGDMLRRLHALSDFQKCIPETGPASAFVEAVESVLGQCGAAAALGAIRVPATREFEQGAYASLLQVLGRIDAWYRLDQKAPSIGRDDFVRVLRAAFRDTSAGPTSGRDGIHCLDADSVRHREFDYVFLGGMNEGEFPRPPALGAIYTDGDLQDLEEHGVILDDKRRHASREMLLFQQTIRAARERLFVTWHLQSREGRQASPSPYLADMIELFPREQVCKEAPEAPAFAPSPAEVACWRDLRNAAFGRNGSLQSLFRREFAPITTGLAVETARQDASEFGVYDGVLRSPSLVAGIGKAFGPDHAFSVNQLESYAECPFRFFMRRLLGVEPEEEPGLEFDPLVRGTILHEVLQAFHAEFAGLSVKAIPEDRAGEALIRHLNRVFDERARRSVNTPMAMLRVERERMAVLLRRYLTLARRNDKDDWKPSHFEISFGNAGPASIDPLTRAETFDLDTPAGIVRFSGRIDRIDTLDEMARIVDYKTSIYVRKADIEAGVALQLPVYALALEEFLMPGAVCAEACLLAVGRKSALKGLPEDDAAREALLRATRAKVAEYVERIRTGAFPPTPYREMCRDCATNRACRYDSGRIERKRRERP